MQAKLISENKIAAVNSAFSSETYFVRGDNREPEGIFSEGITINPNKDGPQK